MANSHLTGGVGVPADRDETMLQHAVLFHVLTEHPIVFTVAELVSELAADPEDFGQRDRVEQAIRALVRVRLLHRHGLFAPPSRAALYFSALWNTYE